MTRPLAPAPNDGRFIPWLIVAFFVAFSCVLGTFAYIAITTHRGVVTEQAYEKGVAYNDTIAKAAAQDALHFSAHITHTGATVGFSLSGPDGRPVDAGNVTLVMFRPTQAGFDHNYAMVRQPDDSYQANIADLPAKGLWEARIHAATPQGDYRTGKRMVIE